MENLIGDFTIQSGDDPAVFETTFPRAVNLEENLEIGIKSIAFGPIRNLLYPTVKLSNSNEGWPLHLADRFYESQGDILLEIQRQILTLNTTNISKLVEKNDEITLELLHGFFLEFHEDMFLNRPFKYKTPAATLKRKRELKYSMTDSKRNAGARKDPRKKVAERLDKLEETVVEINEKLKKMETVKLAPVFDGVGGVVDQEWLQTLTKMNEELVKVVLEMVDEETGAMHEDVKNSLDAFQGYLDKKEDQLDDILANIGVYIKAHTEKAVQELVESIGNIKEDFQTVKTQTNSLGKLIETNYAKLKTDVENQENEVGVLKRAVEEGRGELTDFMTKIAEQLGYDEDQIIASDTTNYSTSTKGKIYTTKVTVSKAIIPSFEMGFLYGDMIERSWLNNQETRLMTTIPLKCQRGYNYYEFKNPVYKAIRVLKFDRLFFYILDKNGKPMKFNLYGDGKKDSKQFPTILNLHVRRTIKGRE